MSAGEMQQVLQGVYKNLPTDKFIRLYHSVPERIQLQMQNVVTSLLFIYLFLNICKY